MKKKNENKDRHCPSFSQNSEVKVGEKGEVILSQYTIFHLLSRAILEMSRLKVYSIILQDIAAQIDL